MSRPPSPLTLRLVDLARQYLREPASWADDDNGAPLITFEPALTAAERTTAQDLLAYARSGLSVTFAEYVALKPDLAGLKTYLGLPSPTAAQTAAATKAIIRVMAAILRD